MIPKELMGVHLNEVTISKYKTGNVRIYSLTVTCNGTEQPHINTVAAIIKYHTQKSAVFPGYSRPN